MSKYSVHQVLLLLETCAFKANVKNLNSKGFGEISRSVNTGKPANEITIAGKYLQDTYSKIKGVIREEKETIPLDPNYADILSSFIGYLSFGGFERDYNNISGWISQLPVAGPHLTLLYPSGEEEKLIRVKQLMAEKRLPFWNFILDKETPDEARLRDSSVILAVTEDPAGWEAALEKTLPAGLPGRVSLAPYIPHDKEQDNITSFPQDRPLFQPKNIVMLVTLLKAHIRAGTTSPEKLREQTSRIIIKNAGAVLTGNNTITAQNISNGDMHINYNK